MIDFHTHIFPDKIAEKTIRHLEHLGGNKAYADGTAQGLLASMAAAEIEYSVVLPVATRPSQFETLNSYAAKHQEGSLISFGGIHPACEDYRNELREIQRLGLKGIKLHPDYQDTYFNDIRYKRIISYANELGLTVVTHAGIDIGYQDHVHCTPDMVLDVLKDTEAHNLVLAHMGGWNLWNEVEEKLAGTNVYFDTAFSLSFMDAEQTVRLIRAHGAKHILFATDSPWASQKEYIDLFQALPLTDDERRLIGSENARHLLKLPENI